MRVKFSKLSLPGKGVAIIAVTQENQNSDNLAKFIKKSHLAFTAELGQVVPAAHPADHDLDLVLLVGLGKTSEITEANMRFVGTQISIYLNREKVSEAALIIDELSNSKVAMENVATHIAYGCFLRNYHFNKYFTDKKKKNKNALRSLDVRLEKAQEAEKAFAEFRIEGEGVFLARDLISEPANILTTDNYAEECKKLSSLGIKVEVLDEKDMAKLGMHSLLGVGQGSSSESKLVVMQWNGADNKDERPLCFVGKGVVFDTGGISIKPALNMDSMKADMGGSAAVVGLMKVLAERNSGVNVVGVVGLVENMPSGTAQRPGDVVKSMSGQTIEILNTDAEGRLVLADALWYTQDRFNPKIMIDLATLTGAIVIALGDVYAGLFSNDDDLAQQLADAGEKSDEKLWRLPLHKKYDEMVNSEVADVKNVGMGRLAGSITAAQFLQRFIGKTKWAHLDIAAMSLIERDHDFAAKGATGFGVRLLNNFIRDNYES
jgi:leucyl aminopeptidase